MVRLNDSADKTSIRTPDQRLRVFVSSTMEELAEERHAASEAIRGIHMSPVLFEIGARPHPPRELYKAYLEQSDVFIGIYGQKYGWTDPGMNISGIEDEYELSNGKPRLIYLKAVGEREERLTELLDRITKERSACYKMFSTSEELRGLIEDDLALLLSERFQNIATGQHVASLNADEGEVDAEPHTPQIQYVTTTDGVSVAYYSVGQGPAILSLMLPFSHLQAEWQVNYFRELYLTTARESTLVRLDHRGFGLSDRDVSDFSLNSLIQDIDAVVERIGAEQLHIYSVGYASIPALAYAARHPDRVAYLIQATPAASWKDAVNERLLKLFELAGIDWELATETITRSFNPDRGGQYVADIAGLVRTSIDRDNFMRFLADMQRWDAEADARLIPTPTLLIHRNNRNADIAATRRVAGLIKDSRVVFADGDDFRGLLLAQRLASGAAGLDISV